MGRNYSGNEMITIDENMKEEEYPAQPLYPPPPPLPAPELEKIMNEELAPIVVRPDPIILPSIVTDLDEPVFLSPIPPPPSPEFSDQENEDSKHDQLGFMAFDAYLPCCMLEHAMRRYNPAKFPDATEVRMAISKISWIIEYVRKRSSVQLFVEPPWQSLCSAAHTLYRALRWIKWCEDINSLQRVGRKANPDILKTAKARLTDIIDSLCTAADEVPGITTNTDAVRQVDRLRATIHNLDGRFRRGSSHRTNKVAASPYHSQKLY